MFSFKLLTIVAVLACVSAYYIVLEDDNQYYVLPVEDSRADSPVKAGRMRRQANKITKVPMAGNDERSLSVIGPSKQDDSFFPTNPHNKQAITTGLALDHVNGHGVTLTQTKTRGSDILAASGTLGLLNTENHKLGATAFATHIMPEARGASDFTTYGGGAQYTYKDTIGAKASAAYTPRFDKTDYSVGSTLNLFKSDNGRSSLDLNAGLSNSFSPYMPSSYWDRNIALTFNTDW